MGWLEKGQSAPFEHQPIDGLFFFDGDMLAKQFGTDWTRGQKYPMIAFTSGDQFELWNSSDPQNAIVHIFGELDLSLKDSRDEALPHVNYIAEQCGNIARPIGQEGIEVFGLDKDDHVVITYDANEQRMTDVRFVLDKSAERPKQPLLDDKSREVLPALYTNEANGAEAMAPVKFFTPDSNWTWYASEGSPVDEDGFCDTDKPKVDFIFFGLVNGFELEYGYFSLSELEAIRGPMGLPIERDRYYEPKTLRELEKLHDHERRGGHS